LQKPLARHTLQTWLGLVQAYTRDISTSMSAGDVLTDVAKSAHGKQSSKCQRSGKHCRTASNETFSHLALHKNSCCDE